MKMLLSKDLDGAREGEQESGDFPSLLSGAPSARAQGQTKPKSRRGNDSTRSSTGYEHKTESVLFVPTT